MKPNSNIVIATVRAGVTVTQDEVWVTFAGITPQTFERLNRFAEPNGIVLIGTDSGDVAVGYSDALAVHTYLADVIGLQVTAASENQVTAARAPKVEYVDEGPSRQSQREIDKVVRKFLAQVKARDIRVRRIGPTMYTWKHEQGTEYDDTGSDVRWELKVTGGQIQIGCFDIKPFFKVLQGIVDAQLLVRTRKDIIKEMDDDARI